MVLLAAAPVQAFAMDDGSMYAVVDGSPVDMWGDTLLFTVPVRTASGARTDLYAESLSRGTRQCLGPVEPGEAAIFVDDVVLAKPTASGTRIVLRNLTSGVIRDLGYGGDPEIGAFAPAGRLAVFTSKRPGSDGTDIWSYRLDSHGATVVAGGPGEQTQPSLDAKTLSFVQGGQGTRVKDLVSGAESTVTTSTEAMLPVASGHGWAAWVDIELVETMDLPMRVRTGLYRTLPDGETRELESGAGHPAYLTGTADYACWTSEHGDRSFIEVRNPSADPALGPLEFGRVTGDGYAQSPVIFGNAIVWRQLAPYKQSLAPRLHIGSLRYNLSLSPSTTSPLAGSAVRLDARVNTKDRKPAVGLPVAIEKWTGSRWSGVGVGTTSTYGRFVCTVRPTAKTTYRLRHVTRGSDTPAFSEKVTIYPR